MFTLLLAAILLPGSAADGYGVRAISTSDSRLTWSPYNWHSHKGYKSTITAGAYVKVGFEGSHLGLKIKADRMTEAAKKGYKLRAYIDDDKKPVERDLTKIEAGELVFANALSIEPHQAKIVVAQSNPVGHWQADDTNRLTVSAVAVESLTDANARSSKVLVYGDSIVESVEFGAETSFASVLGETLGAEYGAVGFGGQGWEQPGVAGRPLKNSWQWHYAGAKRDLSQDTPDAIYNNMGINDANTGVNPEVMRRDITDWLEAARAASGSQTKIYMVVPFNFGRAEKYANYLGVYRQGVQGYLDSNPEDGQVYVIDLGRAGWEAVRDGSWDALHPHVVGSKKLAKMIHGEVERLTVEPQPAVEPEPTEPALSGYEKLVLPWALPTYLKSAIAWLGL
ncbi:MAG: SGNH/GDSL hydrolase family protein [Candidatus Nomurabacteria bacterium]|nr:SGNH/GDSL hydrolase family protein [Candidatus Nomurabacteria bacterium]